MRPKIGTMCCMVDAIHKTLVIRFSSVGDIILSSLLVRALRKRFPSSTIDFLVKSEYAALIQHNPNISRVIEFPAVGKFSELRRLRTAIQRTGYDLIVDIHDSIRSRYLSFGHPRIARINKRKVARFLLVKMKWNVYEWFGGAPGVAERYLETVNDLGVESDGTGLEVFIPESASENVGRLLHTAGIREDSAVIGVCPCARHNNKMWLKERFAEAAAALAREYQAAVLIFGSGDQEVQRCDEVKQMIEAQSGATTVLNLADRISLPETAAMMDRCFIILTNDSGLMHLAAARKRKVVAIFGPTVRELGFFPYGTTSTVIEDVSLPCRPCTHIGLPGCPKGHFKCMHSISTQQVASAARVLLTNEIR